MVDVRDTKDFLLPALSPDNNLKIRNQLEIWSPNLVKTIKTINWSVAQILDSELLRDIISTSFDYFIEVSRNYLNDIISQKDSNIWVENFIKYINLFYLLLNVKKIYNTSPRDWFQDFYNSKHNDQLLRIIMPNWKDLPFLDITTWWSCHNFSIIFKDFFDKLWVDSKIIFCNPVSNHSFLIFNIMWEYYSVDPLFRGKEFIKKIKIGDTIRIWFEYLWRIVSIEPNFNVDYSSIKWENNDYKFTDLVTEKSAEDFSKKLDNRIVKYIIFEMYVNSINDTFRLYIWNEYWNKYEITICIWGREIKYLLNKNKLWKVFKNIWNDSSNTEVLSTLIKYVYEKKWNKQNISLNEILEQINIISNMIKRSDIEKLLNLKLD